MYHEISLCGNPSVSYGQCESASDPDDGSTIMAIEWLSVSDLTTTTPIKTAFTSTTTTVVTLLMMLIAICVQYSDRISNTAIQIWYGV